MSVKMIRSRGVTLVEVLIVFTIVALFLITAYFIFSEQIFRGTDGRRKADLKQLSNILEDFYNDRGCYPDQAEVCYDTGVDYCSICGREDDPIDGFHLPCDPKHSEKDYAYVVESGACPQWYRIYAQLESIVESDPCPSGSCGPDGNYNYGVSSPNVSL